MSDKTLEHEAVKAYRQQFKLCPKIGFREDIIATVTDLDLWKSVLATWGYWKEDKWIKFSPLNVKGMMAEYERRARQSNKSDAAVSVQREGISQRGTARVSEWWHGNLLRVR